MEGDGNCGAHSVHENLFKNSFSVFFICVTETSLSYISKGYLSSDYSAEPNLHGLIQLELREKVWFLGCN